MNMASEKPPLNQDDLGQTYNDVPYTSLVFSHCQPTRLHALAKIKGLDPAPLATAKVLEIGCSFGGNLLPFAIRYPQSQLIGIDLSDHQINIGKQMIKAVGVENVELVAADISQVSFDCKFDYIICHGVLSWVPESVQEAILNTVQNYLSPRGIAFISYNTYPGWKVKEIAKDLMLFGSNENLPKSQRIDQSLETVKFTQNIFSRQQSSICKTMNRLLEAVENSPKYYITHEYFETYNTSIYFREFIQKISNHQLAYVTDSNKPIIIPHFIFKDDEYEKACHFFKNRIENVEQYVDFIESREFRTSLITHQQHLDQCGITNTVSQYAMCHDFYNLYFYASIEFFEKTAEKNGYWQIVGNGIEFYETPLNNALFTYLKSKCEPQKIQDILNYFEKRPEFDAKALIDTLLIIVHSYNVYLCFEPEPHKTYQEKPRVIEKYRRLVDFYRHNEGITKLSNRYYQPIELDVFSQHLISYLDGTRSINDLVESIRQDFISGVLVCNKENIQVANEDITEDEILTFIKQSLSILDDQGYFIHYSQ